MSRENYVVQKLRMSLKYFTVTGVNCLSLDFQVSTIPPTSPNMLNTSSPEPKFGP